MKFQISNHQSFRFSFSQLNSILIRELGVARIFKRQMASLLSMDRESDPSYLEWVRLKDSSAPSAGRDVIEVASKLIETLFEKVNQAEALRDASEREFGMYRLIECSTRCESALRMFFRADTDHRVQLKTRESIFWSRHPPSFNNRLKMLFSSLISPKPRAKSFVRIA